MKKMNIKSLSVSTFIEISFQGFLSDECDIKNVKSRIITKKYKSGKYFRFYDVVKAIVVIGKKEILLYSEKINISPIYRPGKECLLLEEFEKKYSDRKDVIEEAKENDYEMIVISGNRFCGLSKGEIFLQI